MTPQRKGPGVGGAPPGPRGTVEEEPDDVQLARGLILMRLAEVYPQHHAESGLRGEVAEVGGDVRGWPVHVAYLQQSGFIAVEEQTIGPAYHQVTLRSFALTPQGLQVVDGHVRDPSIFIPPRSGR